MFRCFISLPFTVASLSIFRCVLTHVNTCVRVVYMSLYSYPCTRVNMRISTHTKPT